MADPKIAQKSPYVLEVEKGTYFWCACGLSQTQPFCDGSHAGTGLAPRKVTVEEDKVTIAFCGCKQTANGFQCDGTHAKL